MSDDPENPQAPRPYNVGYAKPPAVWQFKKGTSGNPGGRPRKRPLDTPSSLLDQPIAVRENGVVREVHPKEPALRKQVIKALEEDDTAAQLHLLEQFLRHGLLDEEASQVIAGVVTLSDLTMPFEMQLILAQTAGPRPWTKALLAKTRARYLAERSPREAQIDDAIGFAALKDDNEEDAA